MDFMRIQFGVVMLYVHGASASGYVSTTSRGYTSTETGNPFFECYRSSPYLTALVSKGRYVYVYNDRLPPATPVDPANADPPDAIPFTAGNPPIQAFRIDLETTDHRSYGAFYCAASLNGERSVVPTVFLRSDAQFVPTGGRFSKTVNSGDVNVTVDFTEVNPTVGDNKNWRLNGTTDSGTTLSAGTIFTELTVYTIIGEVDTSNAGVYEIHVAGERGPARAGLIRLIVRACPAGRYDVSSGCTRICPSCYNGGVCHDQTGICICPPGFQGETCEMACGGNRYGRNCEYRCDYEISDDRTACSGLQVCVPDPYGCSCTPGYKGLDCTTECDQSEFGASCTETCHCVSGECDRFTGVCTGSSTECEPGWIGTNCQECTIGRYGPNCEPFTVEYEKTNKGQYAIYFCCPEGGNLISTAPVVNLYRSFGSENYTRENIIGLHNGNGFPPNAKFPFLVADVKVGEIFVCSLSDVNNFWSDIITSDGEFTQPELSSAPVVSGATNDSVTLLWDAWDASTDIGDPPLVGYRVYYRNNSQVVYQEVIRSDRLAPSETVTGLSPDTDYVFGVSAERPGVGGQGRRLEVEGTTQCLPPSGVAMSVNASSSSLLRTLHVNWKNPPSEANCRSGLTGVRIYWESVERSSVVQGSIDVPLTASTGYDLTLTDPYTTYAITAAMINSDAEGVRSDQSLATTAEESAPPPSEIQAVSTSMDHGTSRFIIVKWNASIPAHLNGNIKGYTINYERVQPVSEEKQSEFIMTNQLMDIIYLIEGVQEGEKYEILINTVNGVGSGEWSTTKLIEVLGDESRYSLRALLLTGLIPSIILICVICIILIVGFFRRRQPDKGESEKKTHDETQSPGTANTYQDLYERVSNDGTAYQELELTSVQQGDTNYINIEEGPRGRKNNLKSIENF